VADGASPADIWGQQPRVYPLRDRAKGEGITFASGYADLMTVGEECPAVVCRTDWRC
jgi:hypothetical protein